MFKHLILDLHIMKMVNINILLLKIFIEMMMLGHILHSVLIIKAGILLCMFKQWTVLKEIIKMLKLEHLN